MASKDTVGVTHLLGRPHHSKVPFLYPSSLVAEAFDLVVVVRDDQHGYIVLVDQGHDAVFAFFLEHEITDGKNLVDDKYFRNNDCGDGKSDAGNHA